jgi:hypothetical protein
MNIPLCLLVTLTAETHLKEGQLRRLISMLKQTKTSETSIRHKKVNNFPKGVVTYCPSRARTKTATTQSFIPRMLAQTKLYLKKAYYNGSSIRSQQFTNQVLSQRRAARSLYHAKYGSSQSCPSRDSHVPLIAVRSLAASRLHNVQWRGLL